MRKILFGLLGLLITTTSYAYTNLVDLTTAYAQLGTVVQNGDSFTYTPDSSTSDQKGLSFVAPTTVGHKIFISATITTSQDYRIGLAANRELGYFTSAGNPDTGNNIQFTSIVTAEQGRVGYMGLRTAGVEGSITISDIHVFDLTDIFGAGNEPSVSEASNYFSHIVCNDTNCATCDGTVVNYVSATGTVSQSGTPTPTNPIAPTFYTQGDMVLRKVGDYADSYDATTGKITRRVGVKVFDGTENFGNPSNNVVSKNKSDIGMSDARDGATILSSRFISSSYTPSQSIDNGFFITSSGAIGFSTSAIGTTAADVNNWLREQYNAGTPVVVYYQLAEAVEETVPTSYCQQAIKVATTKYVESQFSGLSASLAAAVQTVNTVVTNTITQAASIATLQSGKQTRPDETCPAGKKCLLVEGTDGQPHWYEIITSRLPDGYTELEYIESTGTQYIDTGFAASREAKFGIKFRDTLFQADNGFFGSSAWMNSLTFYQKSDTPTIRYCLNNTAFSLDITNATHSGELISSSSGVVGTFDGQEVSFPQIVDNNGGSGNIYLFSGGRSRGGLKTKIDWFKIWDSSDNLVRDFVPARRDSDDALGMYDLANHRFYTNAGTGTFTAGPVAE